MSLVQSITIESRFSPPIVIDDPFGASSAPASFLFKLIRPKITASIAGAPVSTAPYGEPGQSFWPFIKIALIVVIGLLILRFALKHG